MTDDNDDTFDEMDSMEITCSCCGKKLSRDDWELTFDDVTGMPMCLNCFLLKHPYAISPSDMEDDTDDSEHIYCERCGKQISSDSDDLYYSPEGYVFCRECYDDINEYNVEDFKPLAYEPPHDTDKHIWCESCDKEFPRDSEDIIFDESRGQYLCKECYEKYHPKKFVDRKPEDIYNYLNRYIVGQDATKKKISVAIYEHLKRSELKGMDKSNILLVGPTGCGKTLIAKTIARMLNVPFTIADASALTEAGYIGEDIEGILTPLIEDSQYNKDMAERGIVFIDEIDKIAKDPTSGRDVSGAGVQQGLLKMLEGNKIMVPKTRAGGYNRDKVEIDTTNILFICGGAFPDLEKIVETRLSESSFGFLADHTSQKEKDKKYYKSATIEDFEKFGMLPEFMGRLPIISFLEPLSVDTYKKIITDPENSILDQYKRSYEYEKAKLEITPEALSRIAQKAFDMGTGARALRSIMDSILSPPMFKLPSMPGEKDVTITEDCVTKGKDPVISSLDPKPILSGR